MARERRVRAPAVPAGLAAAVSGRTWFRDSVGESGCAVHRLAGEGGSDLYLKSGSGPQLDDLVDEMVRLRWLAAHLPVPPLHGFVLERDSGWMLTARLPGRTAYQILEDDPAMAPALAVSLAHFLRLAAARDRVDAGLVDETDFGDARIGMSAEQVWAEMMAGRPPTFDRVVTHGDFSLDNLLVVEGTVTGCIDLGRVGIADRW